jgi:hypothetical protein
MPESIESSPGKHYHYLLNCSFYSLNLSEPILITKVATYELIMFRKM